MKAAPFARHLGFFNFLTDEADNHIDENDLQ